MGSSKFSTRLMSVIASAALAAGLMPAAAFAQEPMFEDEFQQNNSQLMKQLQDPRTAHSALISDAYNYGPASPFAYTAYPEKFDLRNVVDSSGATHNFVTPVKNQGPYGTCWGFSATAAAETSIMGELNRGMAYYEAHGMPEGLNLSERHLAYFTYCPLPSNDEVHPGEGYHAFSTFAELDDKGNVIYPDVTYYQEGVEGNQDDNDILFNLGGLFSYASTLYSSGIGPYLELPEISETDPTRDGVYRNNEGYTDGRGYSSEGTWFLPEDIRFVQLAELEESHLLPSPCTFDQDGNYVYDQRATNAIKDELMNKRAVSVAFFADSSMPGQTVDPKYINVVPDDQGHVPWAHYTYEPVDMNHGVVIVGWDDTYSKTNFIDGHQPPADGAWIVKNSWGAKDRGFPHEDTWGIDGTGYFYLSYYDQSIRIPESFDFDISTIDNSHGYEIDQYDYVPTAKFDTISLGLDRQIKSANVFPVKDSLSIKALSCETVYPQTQVTFEVYKLKPGFADPTDGTKLVTITPEVYPYGGYHRVTLTDEQKQDLKFVPGDTYSVVVTMQMADGYYISFKTGLSKDFMLHLNATPEFENNPIQSYMKGVIKPGESYVFDGKNWGDWLQVTQARQEAEKVQNKKDYADIHVAGSPDEFYTSEYDNISIRAYSDAVHDIKPVEAKAPTCTEDGVKAHFACTTCGDLFSDEYGFEPLQKQDVVDPALGHNWLEPTFTFTKDGKAAKAHFVCTRDAAHVLDADAKVSSQVTTPADYGVMGSTTYTATAMLEGKEYSATKIVQDIPALVHEVQEGNNATWTAGADTPLRFHIQGDYDKFTSIMMDDATTAVPEENYTKEPGSVYINLKPAYLATLTPGTHTMTVNFTDGLCVATFTVSGTTPANPGADSTPAKPAPADTLAKTNDSAAMALGISTLAGALAAAALVAARRKKAE